jgi:hypothetical protein
MVKKPANLGIHDGNGRSLLRKATKREELLWVAKELLPNENRLQACMRATVKPNGSKSKSDLPEGVTRFDCDEETGQTRFLGYCSCDNVWLCPRCGPKLEQEKRRLLKDDIWVWENEGYTVAFVVFTLQHFNREKLETVSARVEKALAKMLDSRKGRKFKEDWKIYGRLRSPDYTYGENGHHPHLNALLFLERRCLSTLEKQIFEAELSTLWADYVEKIGGYADLEHGCYVTFDRIYDKADYIAGKVMGSEYRGTEVKPGEWGAAEELTQTRQKTSRRLSFTAAGLLRYYAGWDEMKFSKDQEIPEWLTEFTPSRAGQVFQEYAEVYKGKHFVDSSAGLRGRLEDLKEKYSQELSLQPWNLKEVQPNYKPVVYLGPVASQTLSKMTMVLWLEAEISIAKGDPVKVKEFLEESGITQEVYYPALDPEKPDWFLYPSWSQQEIADWKTAAKIIGEYNSS